MQAPPYPGAGGEGHQGFVGLGGPWGCVPREILEGAHAPAKLVRAVGALNGVTRVRGRVGGRGGGCPRYMPGGRAVRADLGLVRAWSNP